MHVGEKDGGDSSGAYSEGDRVGEGGVEGDGGMNTPGTYIFLKAYARSFYSAQGEPLQALTHDCTEGRTGVKVTPFGVSSGDAQSVTLKESNLHSKGCQRPTPQTRQVDTQRGVNGRHPKRVRSTLRGVSSLNTSVRRQVDTQGCQGLTSGEP